MLALAMRLVAVAFITKRLASKTSRANRLVILGEMNDDRTQFFSIVNRSFRHLDQENVDLRIILHAEAHTDSFWLGRK